MRVKTKRENNVTGSSSEFDYIKENLRIIRERINRAGKYNNGKVKLLAVTKTVSVEKINFAISQGVDLIGENKVSELLEKYDELNKDGIEIHFIGNLQTNKVKYIIDKVSMIQSVNSIRLAAEINKRAAQKNIKMDILVELNIGEEDSKIGISPKETLEFINSLKDFENIRIKGLMTIPPFGKKDPGERYFAEMRKIFIDIASENIKNTNMSVLSMGMSDDFEKAIEYGAGMVRIGSAIFGRRN